MRLEVRYKTGHRAAVNARRHDYGELPYLSGLVLADQLRREGAVVWLDGELYVGEPPPRMAPMVGDRVSWSACELYAAGDGLLVEELDTGCGLVLVQRGRRRYRQALPMDRLRRSA